MGQTPVYLHISVVGVCGCCRQCEHCLARSAPDLLADVRSLSASVAPIFRTISHSEKHGPKLGMVSYVLLDGRSSRGEVKRAMHRRIAP